MCEMVSSMTGYGKAFLQTADAQIAVEIKSLNSKFLDLRLRLSSELSNKEMELRKLIGQKLVRGKVDLSIDLKFDGKTGLGALDLDLFEQYVANLEHIRQRLNIDNVDLFNAVLKLPDIVGQSQIEVSEELWSQILKTVDQAITELIKHRQSEGRSLELDMRNSITNIHTELEQIDPLDEERLKNVSQRLNAAVQKHVKKENRDESRFEQELIYYLERLDINEEKVRLVQHLNYFIEMIDDQGKGQKGKQLAFIAQEIGREINTMGAKSYSSDIQRLVVEMKNELEKIKEQTANVL